MYKLNKDVVRRLSDNAAIPNADGNADWVIYQEWKGAGNTSEPEFTEAQIADNAQQKVNQENQKYLDKTDKFFTRFSETGKAMPEGMAEARAEARLLITHI
tara:strand:- start:918 stop:1220 length:303 start_codon:yes stop_codon:yes gene_type:complete